MIRFFGSLFVIVVLLVIFSSVTHYDALGQFHHLINSVFNLGQQEGKKLAPHVKDGGKNLYHHMRTTTGNGHR